MLISPLQFYRVFLVASLSLIDLSHFNSRFFEVFILFIFFMLFCLAAGITAILDYIKKAFYFSCGINFEGFQYAHWDRSVTYNFSSPRRYILTSKKLFIFKVCNIIRNWEKSIREKKKGERIYVMRENDILFKETKSNVLQKTAFLSF